MAEMPEYLGTEFDIFARKPRQARTEYTTETTYKTIAPIDQTDLEFIIPPDHETYVDPGFKLYISGEFVNAEGSVQKANDYTTYVNNYLHSLFSQVLISLNGVQITQASENYPFRAYIETLLSYGSDAFVSHLTMPFLLLDVGNMVGGDCLKRA
jgi:hypothetical protein